MKEAFLHYIWRTRKFDRGALKLTDNSDLNVLQFGNYNIGDGPDFSEGRIQIGSTVWAGHIEMHLNSSDWHHHRHQFDPGYDNVVLHVVWNDDEPVLNARGLALPTLVLKDLVDPLLISRYEELAANEHAIPCQDNLSSVPDLVLNGWIERMTLQRLERKTAELHDLLQLKRSDWDATYIHKIGHCLGLPMNAHAMDSLMSALPLSILGRYRADQLALEALLLGVGGFLEDEFLDEYPRQLQREFRHLANKHQLTAMSRQEWNYRGLRPASFPTIRLVQLAAIIKAEARAFDAILEAESVKELVACFNHEPHEYWKTHYLLDRPSQSRRKVIGKSAAYSILINAVVPMIFLYGRLQGRANLEDRALMFLEKLPSENNTHIKQWQAVGLVADNAAESQGLLTLRKEYCQKRKCLECAIGHSLLKRGKQIKLVQKFKDGALAA